MKRYGKTADDIIALKQSFIQENDALLARCLDHAKLYCAQPGREYCKICEGKLPASAEFSKLGVPYALCPQCGHLNGLYEDTDEFCDAVYGSSEYASTYSDADTDAYFERVRSIYAPKVEFLFEVLREEGVDPAALSFADLGAGSGYFVAALQNAGVREVVGYDVSEPMVAAGNMVLRNTPLRLSRLDETISIGRSVEADVVSMLGVLEHLQQPNRVISALTSNSAIRYVFMKVPLFSFSVFVEIVFPNVFPRHLSRGHTHLFTSESLNWIARAFRLERIAEWWFGSDMMDLHRSVLVELRSDSETAAIARSWDRMLRAAIDPMQLALDSRHLSSEVHLVFKVIR